MSAPHWAFPIVVGGAVLCHRLFDIDRLVSRTLAYALLSMLLVSVYSTVVVVLDLPQIRGCPADRVCGVP